MWEFPRGWGCGRVYTNEQAKDSSTKFCVKLLRSDVETFEESSL